MFRAGRVRTIGGAALALVSSALVTVLVSQPAMAASSATRTIGWTDLAPTLIRPNTDYTQLATATKVPGTTDGKALKLTLPANPEAGPMGGVGFETTKAYQYGTFGTRMKTADCTGQNAPGVVSAAFTYSRDHNDTNGNGVTDNNEIDFEILCSQPDVVWMTIWTDYSETSNNLRSISRVVNVRTGQVLYNCYIVSYGTGCQTPQAGENVPAKTQPIPGFDASKQFRTYKFDWQPDHITFYTFDNQNRKVVLWDYRGPADRIPHTPSLFMQNVWHSAHWDPFGGGSAHNRPTAASTAFIDSTFLPQ
ncbi:hypothetical protein GCM10022223_20960 [Kineosporia mesophila]|uniref:GH16 domain-containing protein n=1 Tax=Kineosporia mesophila TaxID=566012 RepID=A0ABP6ZC17_9ACTN|nr:glycoside hydrolase family 16 protein [Kineosporia mesophila]